MTKPQLTKELRQIAKIFKKLLGSDMYCLDVKNKIITSPIGYVRFDENDNCWAFNYNYNWVLEEEKEFDKVDSIWFATWLVSSIKAEFNSLIMYDGYYDVYDDEIEMTAGMLFYGEVQSYAEENKIDFDIARNVLTQKLILENRESIEKEME